MFTKDKDPTDLLFDNGMTYTIGTTEHVVKDFDIKEPIRININDANLLYQHVKYLSKVLDEYDLDYFAVGGTLLGAIRHQGVIPWDLDVDVAITKSTYDAICSLTTQLSAIDQRYQWKDTKLPGLRVYYQGSAVIDLFIVDHIGTDGVLTNDEYQNNWMAYSAPYCNNVPTFETHTTCFPKLRFRYRDLFPTHKIPFEDFYIRVPRDAKAICAINYNPQCFTTIIAPPTVHSGMHVLTDSILFSPVFAAVPTLRNETPILYQMYLSVTKKVFNSSFKRYQRQSPTPSTLPSPTPSTLPSPTPRAVMKEIYIVLMTIIRALLTNL